MGEDQFTVSPMSQTMSLEAGKTYDGYISISNPLESESDFEYIASVLPYSVVGEQYTADLTTKSDSSMIVDWTKIENPTGKIEPNETAKIHFKIKVPEDSPAGGQYAVIAVRSNSDSGGTDGMTINNIVEMASIIYAQVQGETIHGGTVLSNNIPGFITSLPLVTNVALTNESNVHEMATIKIEVKDIFGNVIFPKEDESNVFTEITMPNTTRLLTREISQLSDLGVYQVSQSVTYLGKNYDTTQMVFACPLWFLGLVILTLAVAVWTVVKIIRRNRNKKLAL